MSRTPSRSPFVSKTAYELLAAEVPDESEFEEEEVVEPAVDETPSKPSKSALKKAAVLARTQRRQQEKAAAKAKRASAAATPTSAASAEPSPIVQAKPLPVVADPSPPADVPPARDEPAHLDPPVVLVNGDSHVAPLAIPPSPSLEPNVHLPPVASEEPKPNSHVEEVTSKEAPVAVAAAPQPEPIAPVQPTESAKKRQNMLTRTLWTFIMIGGFISLLLLGHAYMIVLVMVCQTLVYREITALFSLKSKSRDMEEDEELGGKDPWSKTLNWYFFAVTNYFLYGESIIYYFKHVVFAEPQLFLFATNHRMISFTLYMFGFVGFVMSLKKKYLKQQFGLFCWVHMTLLIIVVSSHFIVNNILEGLIWFFVPASLVICNDIFAYIWGVTVGRTPLIKLSPKKTVEGFVGAFWSTMVFALLWGTYFMRFDYMICPVRDLGVSAWSSVACTPNPVFLWKSWELWKPVSMLLSSLTGFEITTIPYTPYHLHLLVMAGFASLVAPFGGFFASGFKRAFNIKDFGDSIPGHGGMTDRMDCQFLMGVFMYVYYSSLIREHHVTVGSVLQTIVSGLTLEEQLELIADLKWYLQGKGVEI